MKKTSYKLIALLGSLMLLISFILLLIPKIKFQFINNKIKDRPSQVMQNNEKYKDQAGLLTSTKRDLIHNTYFYDELWDKIVNYNNNLYLTKQKDLLEIGDYEANCISEFDTQSEFGYIEIEKLGLNLPIYIGASKDHLANGVAVLNQTSLPIGGNNTNSVIAGHRGYKGMPFFSHLDKLEIGDKIIISNNWNDLTYQVSNIDIINPTDVKKIMIEDGRDMITLITCHPPRSGGKYRMVIYCDRVY